MPVSHDYFRALAADRAMLRSHGFGTEWPDADGILRYACGIEDGLHALAGAMGLELDRDPRGNWRVAANHDERRGDYANRIRSSTP